jgi:pilus assembly protein CpaB
MNPTPKAFGSKVVRKIRMRAIGFLALALIAGSGAMLLIKVSLDRAQLTGGATTTRKVVVAAMDVPIATQLDAQHVKLVSWPADTVPARSFSKLDQVVGQSVRQALVDGEPLLADRLASKDFGQGLAAILPEGTRAMAVKVDQIVGVAGFVQPGDYVDVITTMAPDDETKRALSAKTAKIAKIILQNIKVLAVGEQLASEGRKPVKVQVVTLAVDPDQSERLALASQHGDIQLTMRSRLDQQYVATQGVTPVALLAGDTPAAPAAPAMAVAETVSERRREPRRDRRRREAPSAVPEPAPAPAPAVVEILRAGRVEERQLRRTADSSTP